MRLAAPETRRAALEARHGPWAYRSLAALFEEVAADYPERPFVMTATAVETYGAMLDRSRRTAAMLAAHGIGAGDHVAILLPNGIAFVAVKLAIARLGAVAVPLNFNLQRDELAYVIGQSDARALVAIDGFRGRDYIADLEAILRPGFPVFVERATGAPHRWHALDGWERHAPARGAIAAGPADLSDIIYTSGTTGSPKGVMLTHDMVLRTAYASARVRAFEEGRRLIFAAPMYHVHGLVECLVAALFAGGAVIPQDRFDAAELLALAVRHQANEISGVPTLTEKLLDAARGTDFACPSLACVFSTGGMHRDTIWEEFRSILGAREIVTGYGMTETTASTTCTLPEEPIARVMTGNGRFKDAGAAAPPGSPWLAEYRVVDAESGGELPPGTNGELLVRGPGVTHGYYKKPEETAAAFASGGWLRVGDIGRVDAEGYLTLAGRSKDVYRCGGETVMPREIEALLETHGQVREAHVVAIADDRMGEVGCACVVATEVPPSAAALIALCESKLARFKVPRHILFFEAGEIPVTPTGRAKKFQLAEMARERLGLEAACAQS